MTSSRVGSTIPAVRLQSPVVAGTSGRAAQQIHNAKSKHNEMVETRCVGMRCLNVGPQPQLSVNAQPNNGCAGQTLETLVVGNETAAFERPIGVPSRSYAAVSVIYHFNR